jgi:hypothetical protein
MSVDKYGWVLISGLSTMMINVDINNIGGYVPCEYFHCFEGRNEKCSAWGMLCIHNIAFMIW